MSLEDGRHPREAISAWLDGELEGSERLQLETHLETCADCRRLADDLRALSRSMAADAVPEPSHALAARISRNLRVERAEALPPSRSRLIPWSVAASLAAAGLLLVVVLRTGVEAPTPEPKSERVVIVTTPAPETSESRPTDESARVASLEEDRRDRATDRRKEVQKPLPAQEEAPRPAEGYVADRVGEPAAPMPPPPRAAESRAAQRARSLDRMGYTAASPPAAKLASQVPCPRPWTPRAEDPPVTVFLGLGTDASLAALVADLPGESRRLATGAASAFRLEIERRRWPELREALVELQARDLPPDDAPPADVDCVQLTVVFETVAE